MKEKTRAAVEGHVLSLLGPIIVNKETSCRGHFHDLAYLITNSKWPKFNVHVHISLLYHAKKFLFMHLEC
jgi:hypothetical protein